MDAQGTRLDLLGVHPDPEVAQNEDYHKTPKCISEAELFSQR